MSARGVYRGIYSALADDPDYQALSPNGRLVLLTARICKQAGPAGIFRYYPTLLAEQTGLTVKAVEAALADLEAGDWIRREGPILWIRNALRHDPSLHLANGKHRTAIEEWLKELPRLGIVLTFCDYYQISKPFDGPYESPTNGPRYIGRLKTEDRRLKTEDGNTLVAASPLVSALTADDGLASVGSSTASDDSTPNGHSAARPPAAKASQSRGEGATPAPPAAAVAAPKARRISSGSGDFDEFWTTWPEARRIAKADALKAWQQLSPAPALVQDILAAVRAQSQSRSWQSDGGKYIPYPHRWLGKRRWEDAPPAAQATLLTEKTAGNQAAAAAVLRRYGSPT